MTPVEVLRKARALIEKPENWGKGDFYPNWPDTSCRCAEAAINEAQGLTYIFGEGWIASDCDDDPDDRPQMIMGSDAERLVECAVDHRDLGGWNDDPYTTHADVLAAFDRAIALGLRDALEGGAT